MLLVLVGERCGGKSTAGAYIRSRYKADYVRFSDTLADILRLLHRDPRDFRELSKLGEALRATFGADSLARSVVAEARRRRRPFVIIDGLRKLGEYMYLKTVPNFHLLYITAPFALRYQRAIKRHEKLQDRISRSGFRALETRPSEVEIPKVGRKAKFRIENTGTDRELHAQLDAVLAKLGIHKPKA